MQLMFCNITVEILYHFIGTDNIPYHFILREVDIDSGQKWIMVVITSRN